LLRFKFEGLNPEHEFTGMYNAKVMKGEHETNAISNKCDHALWSDLKGVYL
jgi:hypothetical protein